MYSYLSYGFPTRAQPGRRLFDQMLACWVQPLISYEARICARWLGDYLSGPSVDAPSFSETRCNTDCKVHFGDISAESRTTLLFIERKNNFCLYPYERQFLYLPNINYKKNIYLFPSLFYIMILFTLKKRLSSFCIQFRKFTRTTHAYRDD